MSNRYPGTLFGSRNRDLEPSHRDREISFTSEGLRGIAQPANGIIPDSSDVRDDSPAIPSAAHPDVQRGDDASEGIRQDGISLWNLSSRNEDDDELDMENDNEDDNDSENELDIDIDDDDDSDFEVSGTDSEDDLPIAASRRRANTGTSNIVPIEPIRAPEIPMVTPPTQELPNQEAFMDVGLGRFLKSLHPVTGRLWRLRPHQGNGTNPENLDSVSDRTARLTNRSMVRRLNQLVDLGVRLHRALATYNPSLVPATMRVSLAVASYSLTEDQVREDTSLLMSAIKLLATILNSYRRALGNMLERDYNDDYTWEIARAWSADVPLSTLREMVRTPSLENRRTLGRMLERESTESHTRDTDRARSADVPPPTLRDRETALDSAATRLEEAKLRKMEAIRTVLHRLKIVPQANLANNERHCNICHEAYLTGDECELSLKLPCGHIFGDSCIQKWVDPRSQNPRNTCPLCRAKIIEPQYVSMPI